MKNKFKILTFLLVIVCVATIAYCCGKNDTITENTNFIPTVTASAAQQQSALEFELICKQQINSYTINCFWREKSTDTMYIETLRSFRESYGSGLTQMLDPETGKPLTYSRWLYSYQ